MCGIYGVVHRAGDAPPPMDAARDWLRHRGPDGEGEEELPHARFGHLRLSILDLTEAGAQPMWDAQHLACITYNGEIYNFAALRRECEAAGLTFRSHTDTEVVLNQYLLHGARAFARLNGMFAFALYDRRSGDTYLVRDRMGIKPLYHGNRGGRTWFASELGAMLATDAWPRELDTVAVQAYLQLDYVPSPLSMVKGIRKLPRAHALRITAAGSETLERYVDEDETVRATGDWRGRTGEFGEIFREVVASQLVADVPVGVFLSGGLDSSLVAWAATQSADHVSTFSIAFEDPSFDERRYFDEVARALRTNHHTEVLTAAAMQELLPLVPAMTSEPLADGSILPTALLARFTRRHVTVALSGDGADELFGGYPTYRIASAGHMAAAMPRGVLSAARRLSAMLPTRFENFSFDYKVRKFVDGLASDPLERHLRWMGTFAPEDVKTVFRGSTAASEAAVHDLLHTTGSRALPVTEQLLRLDERLYLQDGVLVKVDRASMAASLEVRPPFLDDRIVRFAHSLPVDAKVGGGTFKRILKEFAATRLPPAVIKRQKKGFGAPLGRWFREDLKPFVAHELSADRLRQEGILEPSVVRRMLDEHWSGRRDRRKEIFNLLSLVMWCRHFGVGSG